MRNKLLLPVIVMALVILPAISFADMSSSTRAERKETIGDKIEAKREALKQDVASKTDAVRNSFNQARQTAVSKIIEAINQFVDNINTRYDAAINRLDVLASRIESRIAKIEARKIDVKTAKELLATAKLKIDVARASTIDIASTTSHTLFGTTTPSVKEQFKMIKTQIVKAKDDIKTAHAALVDVVNSLKPGDNKMREMEKESNKNASSTATTTDSND